MGHGSHGQARTIDVIGFLLDENLPNWWQVAIQAREPHLQIWKIGDGIAPPKRTADPVIFDWCEINDAVLLTDNRTSMPLHLANHVAAGRHVPGIFHVSPRESIIIVATSLAYVYGASLPDEYRDMIAFMPRIVVP